jgi:hypothetical protein
MSAPRYTLEELLRKAMDARVAQVRVAIPGQVVSYDKATQTANIQPIVDDFVETETETFNESLPQLQGVPVAVYSGGGFFVHVPLVKGDTGLLVFQERSIDLWLKTGKQNPPQDLRRHHLGSAVFYPGVHDSTHALNECQDSMLVAGKDGGLQLRVSGSAIELGAKDSPSLDFVALAAKVKGELTKLVAEFKLIQTAITGVGGVYNPAYTTAGEVKASKVKAE